MRNSGRDQLPLGLPIFPLFLALTDGFGAAITAPPDVALSSARPCDDLLERTLADTGA